MFSTLLDRYHKRRNRCRSCEVDGIHGSLIDGHKNIREIARYKTVCEYKCDQCGTVWLLADRARFLIKVVKHELYAQWKSQSWAPTVKQIDALSIIGGAPDYDNKNVYFPCAIRLPNGVQVQRAILIATTGDCFRKFPIGRNVTILKSDYEISPSDYALPANVRAVTMVAREKSMAYAPVNVKDADGNQYTLSGQDHFFEKNGVLGPTIILDPSPYHGKNRVRYESAEMYLICDMFDCGTTAR